MHGILVFTLLEPGSKKFERTSTAMFHFTV